MKKIYFTPGPTELYPTVPQHIAEALTKHICSISHRSETFQQIYRQTFESIKRLLNIPNNFFIFFLGSATEAMERIVENCVREFSFHFVNGAFSNRFFSITKALKKRPQKIEVELGCGFDFTNIEIPKTIELICFTQNETSSGVAINMDEIYAIKRKYPDKLIAVDIVSSTPYVDIDYSLIDCTFFSVQKGFGLPAGLGVLIVNDQCIEKARMLENKTLNIGSYHNFCNLLAQSEKYQTTETPNVLGIFLLGKICDNYLKIDIKKIRNDTEIKAFRLYEFFEKHPNFNPFVKNKADRSNTVIVINTPCGSQQIIERLAKKGFIVGAGYGKEYREKQIRIANFPMHTLGDVEELLSFLLTFK
jgi:phosphoserine aminotransferase